MSTAVSPLAPANVPDMPPISGVRLATAEAGIRYAGRTDVLLALFDPGTHRGGRFHALKVPVGARRVVPRASEDEQDTCTGREFRQCQRLHGQDRARCLQVHRADRRACGWLQAGRCVSCLDRRDRRTAEGAGFRGRHGRPGRARAAGRIPCRSAGDHDHRHVSQGGDRDGKDRQNPRDDQRHRQGRRHDRSRHGDHAFFHIHRCGDFRAGTADASERRRRRYLQRRDNRR